ncbi:glycosyltransferase family 4 protein [Enterovirga sp.]|uniref:glycosyltransferase family 4 protein n=1 Tax=Enterovirga sp. TaxID=2026350 RepID=UPI00260C8F4C|nr:glycosyltransferase family 4 protein [Enterovirga sp.]MDB5592760.1 glycosyl transferase family 1 [Enterovirga sp.]
MIPGLHVLLTADAVGGVWTYAAELARGLSARGARVTLAVLGPNPTPSDRAALDALQGVTVVETGLPLDWLAANAAEVRAAGRALAGLARDRGADLVHLNSPALAAEAPFDRPLVATCHSCVRTWWKAVRGDAPLDPDLAWRADLTGLGYAGADQLLAPSRSFAAATAAAYGLARPPVAVLNGHRPDTASREALPRDLPATVLTAGRLWDEGKNVATFDRAAAALEGRMLAAGPTEGPNGARVELRHVQALGRLSADQLAAHLSARPVFVSPALYEPFGLAVLEAAEAGCALVLSDIPSFRELWDGAALFVPAEDDRRLAAALSGLLRDPGARNRLGAAARERARRFTADRMVEGTLDAYRDVLGRPRRPAALPSGLSLAS